MDKMASKVGETMKETQRSLQDEIITLQMQNQVRGQDRMMRQQMAIGMAMSRTQAEVFGEISMYFHRSATQYSNFAIRILLITLRCRTRRK